MVEILPDELAALPRPNLVDELDIEVQIATFVARFVQLMQAAGIQYDVQQMESDPAKMLLEVAGSIDTNLRARINEAIQSWFLPFAYGGDLDILAQWYDVTRMFGETDAALRRRIIVNIKGRSPGGTEDRYRAIALGADVRVADAAVYTILRDPTIHVAIFSTDNSGVADSALIAKVNAALQDPKVRMVNDRIVVAGAARQSIAVTANVWLLPSAPEGTLDIIRANLAAAWARDMLLGRDVTRSWLLSKIQIDGVQRVDLVTPSADIEMPFNQAAAIGTVTLNMMGRAY